MAYPGVKLKTLVYVPHINLWKRRREKEREGLKKRGVHDETKKLLDLSSDCEPLNCNQLYSTLDNGMFQYMSTHNMDRSTHKNSL